MLAKHQTSHALVSGSFFITKQPSPPIIRKGNRRMGSLRGWARRWMWSAARTRRAAAAAMAVAVAAPSAARTGPGLPTAPLAAVVVAAAAVADMTAADTAEVGSRCPESWRCFRSPRPCSRTRRQAASLVAAPVADAAGGGRLRRRRRPRCWPLPRWSCYRAPRGRRRRRRGRAGRGIPWEVRMWWGRWRWRRGWRSTAAGAGSAGLSCVVVACVCVVCGGCTVRFYADTTDYGQAPPLYHLSDTHTNASTHVRGPDANGSAGREEEAVALKSVTEEVLDA